MRTSTDNGAPHIVGRYAIGGVLASGGMAAVHLGRIEGPLGFARRVAVKRMLAHFVSDPEFATMFADEARLAARVRHPNVVPTFDVVMQGHELCIVMEYVQGVTLAQLAKLAAQCGRRIPPAIAAAIVRDALQGLHAAHEAVDDRGQPLGIVHRDVSPQNILVGVDGIARVLDFGVAKANVRLHQTRDGGGLKGKLAYMAPEQLEGRPASRASDIFAASVVFWEALTAKRLFGGVSEGAIVTKIVSSAPELPSCAAPELPSAYDAVVMRGLARAPDARYATASEMAVAIAAQCEIADAAQVGEWVSRVAAELLSERTARVRELEGMLDGQRGATAEAAVPDEHTLPATEAWAPPDSTDATRVEPPVPLARTASRAGKGARVVAAAAVAVAVCAIAATALVSARSAARAGAQASSSAVPAAPTEEPTPAEIATRAPSATALASSAPPPASTPAPAPRPNPTAPRAPQRPAPPSIPDHL